MNGILTVKDEATQRIINHPVFIPYIVLKLDGACNSINPQSILNSHISNINNVDHVSSSSITTESLQTTKHIENDHNYCLLPRLSGLMKRPLLDGVRERKVLSLKPTDHFTEENVTSLTRNDISNSHIDQKVMLIDSEVPPGTQSSLELCEYKKRRKKLEKCDECGKDICAGFMQIHFAKHKRAEQKKFGCEREKERMKENRKQTGLECKICNVRFDSKEEYKFHLQLHPPFICDTCGKSFVKRDSLNAHKNTHNDPNSFICEVCGKGCKDAGAFRVHLQRHENNTFKCKLCSKCFNQKSKLAYHVKKYHKAPSRLQCVYCGKLFINISNLNVHVRLVHFKEKPYECDICHKQFGRRDYLRNHLFCHTGQSRPKRRPTDKPRTENVKKRLPKIFNNLVADNGEPLPCKLCGKSFPNLVALKRHLLTHVKRYSCQFCPLTFCSKALSARHEKIHKDGTVKFFRCNVCYRRFKTEAALDEHSASHKNARYACDLCERTFSRRYLMNHHKLMDHIDVSDKDEPKEIIIQYLPSQ